MIPGAALNLDCPVNWAHPLNRGRVAWWLAHPSIPRGNTWHELCGMSSRKAYDGTLSSGAMWKGNCGRTGGYGSVNFDGVNDYLDCTVADGLTSGVEKTTISAWVHRGSTGIQTLLGKSSSNSTAGVRFSVVWFSDNKIYFTVGATAYSGTNAITTTGWHLVSMVYDGSLAAGSRIVGYVNGVAPTQTTTGTPPTTTPTQAGYYVGRNGTTYAPMLADDVSIWNRALSASENNQYYQQSRLGHPETLNWI
jgi:Concanavalin A-like lectin/glucanases superfamily